ncbi:peptidase M24, structural domain-containing protein [Polychytrium aggregatum]|uniref:peptidase M24, structural domain-containing protein n=1 Tax=Polychytrium aggregatum TaxID=110093 RepID=UPI0022FEBA76|nr:peptidase M24, structural domain-containing protein [Polychytrium aggregatum]KAI9207100.1 peptidase M24, structural domain-containing protein [Polychytrium aggregatum]
MIRPSLLLHLRTQLRLSTSLHRQGLFTFASKPDRLAEFGRYDLLLPNPQGQPQLPSASLLQRSVPAHIRRPLYDAHTGRPLVFLPEPEIKSSEAIAKMKASCQLAKKILQIASEAAREGVTTNEIDRIAHDQIITHNAYPSPLGYMGFPKSICTSINNVVVHGIPDDRPLKNGDMINIDVTVYLDGYHGDTSATVLVGDVDEAGRQLAEKTKEAMHQAIALCKPGAYFSDIGYVINTIADQNGYSVNSEFCGHGIGRHFHEPPLIYHFENDEDGVMEEGMTFTIEPIFNQGTSDTLKWDDNWTAVTKDGGRSAQFEHTILITQDGHEILTA